MDTKKINLEIKKSLEEYDIIIDSILTKSEFFFHTNEKGKKPYIIYDNIYYGEDNAKIDYTKLMKIKKYSLENKGNNSYDNFKAFFVYLEKVEGEIEKEFKYNYCLYIKMNFKKEMKNNNKNKKDKDYNDYDNDNLYSISCEFTFDHPINGNKMRYKDENILNETINAKNNGFIYMLFNINSEVFKDIKYKNNMLDKKELSINSLSKLNDKESSINSLSKFNDKELSINSLSKLNDKNCKQIKNEENKSSTFINQSSKFRTQSTKSITPSDNDKYTILEFSTVIPKYTKSEKSEKELSKTRINNSIIEQFKKNYVNEKIINESKNDTSLKSLEKYYFSLDKIKNEILMKESKEITSVVFTDKNIFILKKPYRKHFLNSKPELTKIYNKSYIGGIKVNENLVALTSNSVLSNGEDKLLIYNLEKKKFDIELDGYSFILSQNNLSLINIPESFINHENKKIILGACKRYTKVKKNGILLIILENTIAINKKFYNTKNFEVFCFCQITNVNLEELLKNQISYTKYFFVGGYDTDKKRGLIKLYQIDIDHCEIIYIQDIIIKKNNIFKKFIMPITSITQYENSGNILITCADGNAYLFKQPELGISDLTNDIKLDN